MSSSSISAIIRLLSGATRLLSLWRAAAEHFRCKWIARAAAVAVVGAYFADNHFGPVRDAIAHHFGHGAVAPADAHAQRPDKITGLNPNGAALGGVFPA